MLCTYDTYAYIYIVYTCIVFEYIYIYIYRYIQERREMYMRCMFRIYVGSSFDQAAWFVLLSLSACSARE